MHSSFHTVVPEVPCLAGISGGRALLFNEHYRAKPKTEF